MNWLAHLRLGPDAPLVRLGNLAGDFVRGVDVATLHPELQRGIAQHRAVDRFVDAHPVHRRSRARFDARFRRFAGVALDVFYDHYLARDWPHHGDGGTLERFVDDVHEAMHAHGDELPPELRALQKRFARHRWLTMYRTVDGIERVLQAMARRSPRAGPLATVTGELRRHYAALDADFAELWPELLAFAADGFGGVGR